MNKYFVDGLSPKQIEAFEQIAIGNDSGHNSRILKKLMEKQLIEQQFERRGQLYIYRYIVPIPVHMEWCKWCSENVSDDANGL